MSATYPDPPSRLLKNRKPTAWCCAQAAVVIGAGVAAWVAATLMLLRM
jgi:hypothetical protein